MITFAVIVLAVLAGLEIFTAGSVYWLQRSCQWLITPGDVNPEIDRNGLRRFIENSWDPHLGWVRKPDTSGQENGKDGTPCLFHINSTGARVNPGYDDRPPGILVYGDSYAFARQVNDDQTWAHQLSARLDVNTVNKGVGNYGLDQALLRLEREFDETPAPVVVMAVVPETLGRVLGSWRHFSEYGNTFAFKPRFVLKDGRLTLSPNPMDTPEKFLEIESILPGLMASDPFYERKFKPDILRFPYLWHLWRSRRRNLPLMAAALADRFNADSRHAFCRVMERNINLTAQLYGEPGPIDVMVAIIERFAQFVRTRGAEPVFLMLPQLYDLKHLRAGDYYYAPLLEKIADTVTVIDLGPEFTALDDDDAHYIDDRFGGHLSALGHRIVTDRIADVVAPMLENATSAPRQTAAEGGSKK